MSANFEAAFGRVKELVADFRANEKFYLSPAYQEAEARQTFIDKFWHALGWDVYNDTQKNPFEQEVKIEHKKHGFSQRRADYAFYLAPIVGKNFKVRRSQSAATTVLRTSRPATRFVHGCELLPA
jgi:adenine-specific DNA-methyltransferase